VAKETPIFVVMFSVRKLLLMFCLMVFCLFASAQTDSNPAPVQKPIRRAAVKRDTTQLAHIKPIVKDSTITRDSFGLAKDSIHIKDSVLLAQKITDSIRLDSIKRSQAKLLVIPTDTSTYSGIFGGLYIPINLRPIALLEKERNPQGKDELFYILVGLVALVAFTKAIFPKYFINMFSLFFQTTYRQKQAVEQLTHNKVSSILLNIVFIGCMATYVSLILNYKGLVHINFWVLLGYSVAAIASIYLFKFIFLNFIGWAFNARESLESYTFVVFLSNKIIAIILLPFVFLIAFNEGEIAKICLFVTYGLLGLALLYRYFVVMGTLRNELRFHALHFFLYLCAVEILPLLLIYKAVFNLIASEI